MIEGFNLNSLSYDFKFLHKEFKIIAHLYIFCKILSYHFKHILLSSSLYEITHLCIHSFSILAK